MEVTHLLNEASVKMHQALQHIQEQLKGVQAHKITRESLATVRVNAYDRLTPLSQLARVNVVDSQTLSVEPYEKSLTTSIESAISKHKKDHFVRQNKTGAIFVSLPTLTQERRGKLVKEVQQQVEQGKVNIRNRRTDAKKELKALEKEGVSEDEIKKAEGELQKITDQLIRALEELSRSKEERLMTV